MESFPRNMGDSSLSDDHGLKDLDELAQDYEVPKAVKLALDADIKQANAVAITSALFATALLTLAQMVSAADTPINTTTATWGAIRFFTYSAIIQNLTSCFICLMIIKMCTDVPHRTQQSIANHNNNTKPSRAMRVARGEVLPRGLMASHYKLLQEFGMSRYYRFIDSVIFPALVTGAFTFTFVALTIWIWATQTALNAGLTMITVAPACLSALFVFNVSFMSQGWH